MTVTKIDVCMYVRDDDWSIGYFCHLETAALLLALLVNFFKLCAFTPIHTTAYCTVLHKL